MSAIVFFARERWFELGLRFFAVGALVALLTVGVVWLPQLRVIAAVALVQALLGVLICAWGLREFQPARFNILRMRTRAVGHRLRQRLRPPSDLALPSAPIGTSVDALDATSANSPASAERMMAA